MMRWLWIGAGSVCLGIGVAGTVLPLVPTTPMLLLAAFCFARSSERLHDWLVNHPTLGPPIAVCSPISTSACVTPCFFSKMRMTSVA